MKFIEDEIRAAVGGVLVVVGWSIGYGADLLISLGCAIAGIERTEDLIPDEDDL